MKNRFFAFVAAALAFVPVAYSQQYAPHEQWPFIYEDFVPAEVIIMGGDRVVLEAANIGAADGKLYFVENDSLKVTTRIIAAARLAGDDYVLAQAKLMRLLKRSEHGVVLLNTEVDREAMSRKDVGYGFKSSVSSVEKKDIFEGPNGSTLSLRLVQHPVELSKMRKNGGEELILTQMKYLSISGVLFERPLKSSLRKLPWVDSKRLNAFWSKRKVRYGDDDSLADLVDFLWEENN